MTIEETPSKLSRASTAPSIQRRSRGVTSPPKLSPAASTVNVLSQSSSPAHKKSKRKSSASDSSRSRSRRNTSASEKPTASSLGQVVTKPPETTASSSSITTGTNNQSDSDSFSFGSDSDEGVDHSISVRIKKRNEVKIGKDIADDTTLAKEASFLANLPATSTGRRRKTTRSRKTPRPVNDFFASQQSIGGETSTRDTDDDQRHLIAFQQRVKQVLDDFGKASYAQALSTLNTLIGEIHERQASSKGGDEMVACISGIRFLVGYKMACLIGQLLENASQPERAAELSRILADIPLMQHHRVVAIQMAIECNMVVHNYGVVANLCVALLPVIRSIPQHTSMVVDLIEKIEKTLKQCEEKEKKDALAWPDTATKFKQRVRFCCETMTLLDTVSVQCSLCRAMFANDQRNAQDKCSVCFKGILG